MEIPEKGIGADALFEQLEQYRSGDLKMHGGKMFGHAFIANELSKKVVEKAFTMYLWENGLDPGLFPSLTRLENEIVEMSRRHLRGDEHVAGSFTSGGTESILLAVKAARDIARAERGITEPEMVLPVTAHAAFHKAAHYFCLKVVPVPVSLENYKADVNAVREAITGNTALIVASAPSYAHGVVDPIPEIGEIAAEKGIPFHVDGCIGAFLLPYYRELGQPVTDFDFAVPGVTSISMDFHKYAFAAKGASVVLYRNKSLRLHQIFTCSDWTGYTILNPTVQSSRSGGPLAATWAVMRLLGQEGYRQVTRELIEASEIIFAAVGQIDDLYLMGKPEMCIFSIASKTIDVFKLVDEMKARGWHIQAQFGLGELPENFHMTILPPNVAMIGQWVEALKDSVAAAKASGGPSLAAQLKDTIADIAARELADEEIGNLFRMVGVGGDGLPEKMADINGILNALPPRLADRLLAYYYNEVSRYRESP